MTGSLCNIFIYLKVSSGWTPAVVDTRAELDFIRQAQRGLSHDRSYWIGGSTDSPPWSTTNYLNQYRTSDMGSFKLIIMKHLCGLGHLSWDQAIHLHNLWFIYFLKFFKSKGLYCTCLMCIFGIVVSRNLYTISFEYIYKCIWISLFWSYMSVPNLWKTTKSAFLISCLLFTLFNYLLSLNFINSLVLFTLYL